MSKFGNIRLQLLVKFVKIDSMKITWHGQSCFKIVAKETTIVTDPFSKDIGLTPPRFEANIVTVSHDHHDHNNVSTLRGEPFVVEGPGEYDLKGVSILGIDSFHDNKEGKERGNNIIFVIEAEEIKVCHLGDLGQKELTNSQLEEIGDVDILMIPVGGVYTVDGEEAAAIINQIEPRIVIPMHYKIPDLNIKIQGVETFLKEMGTDKQTIDQLVIKNKDLPKEEEMKLIVLKIS